MLPAPINSRQNSSKDDIDLSSLPSNSPSQFGTLNIQRPPPTPPLPIKSTNKSNDSKHPLAHVGNWFQRRTMSSLDALTISTLKSTSVDNIGSDKKISQLGRKNSFRDALESPNLSPCTTSPYQLERSHSMYGGFRTPNSTNSSSLKVSPLQDLPSLSENSTGSDNKEDSFQSYQTQGLYEVSNDGSNNNKKISSCSDDRINRLRRSNDGLSNLAVQSLSNLAKKRGAMLPQRDLSPSSYNSRANASDYDSKMQSDYYLSSSIDSTNTDDSLFHSPHSLNTPYFSTIYTSPETSPSSQLNNLPFAQDNKNSLVNHDCKNLCVSVPMIRKRSNSIAVTLGRSGSLITTPNPLVSYHQGKKSVDIEENELKDSSYLSASEVPFDQGVNLQLFPGFESGEQVSSLDPGINPLSLGHFKEQLIEELRIEKVLADKGIKQTISDWHIKHEESEESNQHEIFEPISSYSSSKPINLPKVKKVSTRDGHSKNAHFLRLHSNSWPPSYLASLDTISLFKIETLAERILTTTVEMMVNSTVCQDIMKEFRLLLQKLRKMTVGNAEAEDLLSKLVFEFSPCCRLSEYINDYNKKEMEIKHYENQYLLSQPISPSPLRHSTSFIQSGLNLPKLQFEECSGIVSEPISPLKDEVKQSISSNMMVASKSYDSSNYIESEEKVKNLRRPSIFSVNSKPKPNFLRRLSVQLNKPDKKEMNIKKTETMNPPQRKNSIGNLMDNFGFKSIIDKSKLKGSSTLPIRSKKRDKESSLQLHNRTKSGDVSLFKGWPFSTSQNDLTDNNTESIVCRICDETVYKHDFEHHSEECAITQLHEMKFHEIHNEYGVILSELGEALNEKKLNQEGATIVKKFIKHIKILEKESNDLLGLCMENIIDEENWIKKKLKEIMYFSKDLNFVKNYAKQTLEVSNSLRSVVDNYLEKLRHLNKDSISIPSSPTSTTNYFSRGRSKEVSESRLRHMNKLYRSNSNTSSTSSEDSPMSQKLISLLSGMLKNSLRKNKSSPTSSKSSDSNNSSKRGKIPQINDFEIIKPISRGAFGKVYLSRKKATQDLFAIKVIRKDDMIRKNMIREVMTERKVMSLAQMPYVVNLFYAFHSKNYLYLVQEYLIGGDLSSLITGMGGLTIEMARFYTAETALALNYLHKNGVIHRDLKPDNILLNGDGHLKLTDFGLSRIVVKENERSQTVSKDESTKRNHSGMNSPFGFSLPSPKTDEVTNSSNAIETGVLGTPDYLAPELLLGIGHHTPVDWWALGVCLFEFLCAYPPFMDGSPEAIFKNILDHNIQWPEDGIEDPLAEDLIKGLLNSDPNSRLQGERIKEHPFFSGLDFDTIRESEAPFKPCPEDLLDTSYFDMRNERPDIQKLEDENGFDVDIMMESGEADRESKENKRHSQQKEEVQVKVIKPDKESGLFTPQPKHASLKKGRPRAISASYNQKNIEPDFDAFVYKNIPLLSEYNKDLSSSPSRNRVSLPAQAKSSSFT